jgi:hypothetical protein
LSWNSGLSLRDWEQSQSFSVPLKIRFRAIRPSFPRLVPHKELEPERFAISGLITSDPFFLEHSEAILFDKEPITGKKASKPYLDSLDTCQIYILLINREYGTPHGDLSATHHEYRHAQLRKLPTLVFVKSNDDHAREERIREFLMR